MNDDGATKTNEPESLGECMGRGKHAWQWIWHGSVWTENQRCMTCNAERHQDGLVLKPGVQKGEI